MSFRNALQWLLSEYEADVSLKEPKPKTIEEVLQRVEHETGVEGRRAFEGFLKKMHKTKEEQGDE